MKAAYLFLACWSVWLAARPATAQCEGYEPYNPDCNCPGNQTYTYDCFDCGYLWWHCSSLDETEVRHETDSEAEVTCLNACFVFCDPWHDDCEITAVSIEFDRCEIDGSRTPEYRALVWCCEIPPSHHCRLI